MNKVTVVIATLLVSSAIACLPAGKDGAQGPAGPPGAPSGGDTPAASSSSGAAASSSSSGGASSSSGAASSSSSSSGGSSGTPPPAATKTGTVTITQTTFTAGETEINSYAAMASFIDATGAVVVANGAKCTTSKEGACDVTACDTTGVDNGGGGNNPPPDPKKQPSASDITITAADEITLSPDGKGIYTPMSGQTALYAAGDDIKVKAKGAEVPAFEKTVKAPAIISVTTPEWPEAGAPMDIDRTADMAFAWDNGGAGDVTISLTSTADKKMAVIQCKFKSADGKGTITKAALGKLVQGDTGSISVTSASTVAFDQGGWKLNLSAQSPATTGAGSIASGIAHIN